MCRPISGRGSTEIPEAKTSGSGHVSKELHADPQARVDIDFVRARVVKAGRPSGKRPLELPRTADVELCRVFRRSIGFPERFVRAEFRLVRRRPRRPRFDRPKARSPFDRADPMIHRREFGPCGFCT